LTPSRESSPAPREAQVLRTRSEGVPMSEVEAVAGDQLKSFVERIERLEEEKKTIADDIKDVYAEAKGNGFDTKVLRKVIQLRRQDQNERAEQDAVLDLYMQALGMG
jgi:uncharacterized protein (UPF0335 family)